MSAPNVVDLARLAFEAYQETAFVKPPMRDMECVGLKDGTITERRRRTFDDLVPHVRQAWIDAVEVVLRRLKSESA
jgi:hypothetical protein